MDMRVDAAGGDNVTFTGDHLGSRTDNNVDVRLDVRIAGFAYGGNTSFLNADVGLHNSPVIENQGVSDDGINRALAARTLRLAHAVANDFPTSELHLLAVHSEILLHLDDKIGICKAHLVTNGWAKHLRIGGTAHCVRHFRYLVVIFGSAPMTALLKP